MTSLPRVVLGKTGVEVTRLGLGGEGVLRTFGREEEAVSLIRRALDLGVTYFDCARAYSGSEEYYGLALDQRRRKDIFLCSKTHDRTRKGSRRFLETTLRNMKTDYLDLWQFHDVRTEADLDQALAVGGCLEAFDEARKAGYVRFVGITGHYDPNVIAEGMNAYSFDTLLMPVNPCEPHYLSFLDIALPEAKKKGMGIIGMKTIKPFYSWVEDPRKGAEDPSQGKAFSIPELLNFALSQGVDVVITGCDTIDQLEENVSIAEKFAGLSKEEINDLMERGKKVTKLMIYKRGSGG